MAQELLTPNVIFDVYRGYNPANPYAPPSLPAALAGRGGRLRQHVRNGRFGYTPAGARPIHWTTVLDVAVGTDVRSAYNAQLNVFNEVAGDTVMVYDYPVPGTCCAFCVVMVQLRSAGTPSAYLRCYLDRARPLYAVTCPDPNSTGNRVNITCCPAGQTAPLQVVARISNTSGGSQCLQGAQFTLDYLANVDGQGNPGYLGEAPTQNCPDNAGAGFLLVCGAATGEWGCLQVCGVNLNAIGVNQLGPPCDPLAMTFTTANNGCYGGSLTITFTET
jgi:hypothetical protein